MSGKKGPKAAAKEVSSSYEIRDIVLGKVRGFPPWPGMVVEPSTVPPGVLKERPSNKKTVFYCVQFFPTGEYAWLLPKDISKLQRHEIESYINEPFKKSGDLLNGYRIALEPTKWEEERRNMIDAAGEQDEEEDGVDEVDELQSGDEDGKAKKNTKKRKRESEGGASTKGKAAKNAKAKNGDAPKKPRASTGKGKKNGKSKEMVESEDDAEGDGDDGPSKKASPPPAKKAKRDREDVDEDKLLKDPEACKVRDWRHRLQKTFLSAKTVPKEQDMPGMDQLFTSIETYNKMNIEYLQFSKIGKVMRHITALEADKVPKDDEFKFRERAKVLVDKWHLILGNSGSNKAATINGTGEAAANGTASGPEAMTNGVVNGGEEETKDVSMEGTTNETKIETVLAPDAVGDMSVLADVTMSETAD